MPPEEVDVFKTEERRKKLTEAQRRVRQKETDDVKVILKTPAGRRFFWRLWGICGIFRNPFHPNSNQHSFNSGRMSIGQGLLDDVNDADGSAYARIQNEYVSALKSKKEAQSG